MPLVRKTPAGGSGEAAFSDPIARLRGGTADERFAAARALADAPGAVPALVAALAETTDPRLREAMLTSLARQNSLAGYDAIVTHLRADDSGLRSLALDAMRLMPERSLQRLPALLRDDDPDIRVLATELARHIPAQHLPQAAGLLAALLPQEPEVNVCAAAIEVLAEIGGVPELPLLAACAARFPGEVFLNFSVRAASERISARAGA